jgi:hypothetical protein
MAADYTIRSQQRLAAHTGTVSPDQSTAVRFRLVAIVFLCIGLLSGGLIAEIKQNISISYHRGGPAPERRFGLQSSFGL